MNTTKFLEIELKQLEGYIPQMSKHNLKISKAPVGWHLDHMLKTILHIRKGLTVSNPKTYRKNFSALRVFCHTFNFIPRGRAQSPKYVLPPEVIKAEDLLAQLEEAKTKLQDLKELDQMQISTIPFLISST